MRIGYVLWAVVAVIWLVLAVLSNEPEMRWGFAVAAALAVVAAVFGWLEQRKKNVRGAESSKDS